MKRKRADEDPANASAPSTPSKSRARTQLNSGVGNDAALSAAQPSSSTRRNAAANEKSTPRSATRRNARANRDAVTQESEDEEGESENDMIETATPSKGNRIRGTPKISTPSKRIGRPPAQSVTDGGNAADRSARKKSAKVLMERGMNGIGSDGEDYAEEDILARQIREEDAEEELDASDQESGKELEPVPETPSKRGRGRPKGSKKKRTPSPPPDVPPYEHYFFQNRTGATKTSGNTLSSLSLLSHEEYFQAMSKYKDRHEQEQEMLEDLHSLSFDQWMFELEEGFSICLYGWGSKRNLLSSFASHLHQAADSKSPPKILVVNGYNPSLTIRDVLSTLASAIPSLAKTKLGSQPADTVATIISALSSSPPTRPIVLLVHSIDSQALRRLATQSLLGTLVNCPHIQLIASADTPNFALLWDAPLKAQFNWVFHDTTTFRSYDTELAAKEGGVVGEVNALLGRSGRAIGGREGVVYVLRSLTESARRLYALLLGEVLSVDEDLEGGNAFGQNGEVNSEDQEPDDFEAAISGNTDNGIKTSAIGALTGGIEYNALYRKAMGQLIATSEMAFRTLLKEFYDHHMLVSRRDTMGTEILGVPLRREECVAVLEELVVDEG